MKIPKGSYNIKISEKSGGTGFTTRHYIGKFFSRILKVNSENFIFPCVFLSKNLTIQT